MYLSINNKYCVKFRIELLKIEIIMNFFKVTHSIICTVALNFTACGK